MSDFFELDRFFERILQILPYLSITLQVVAISMIFGTILGIIVAVLRINKIPVLHQLLGVYISFMRGTPLLVQMMIVYYGLPILVSCLFEANINHWDTLIFIEIAIVLNEGAFLGEIFRSAILAVPAVQTEAAYSIGMTRMQAFFHIVLPQAIKFAIPSYGIDFIGVVHNTSLVFMLGVIDIMGRAKTLGTSTGHALEGFLVVTLIYITISLLLKVFFVRLESKLEFGRR